MQNLAEAMAETLQTRTGPLDFEQYAKVLKELDFKPPCRCSICELQYRYNCSENLPIFSYMGELENDEAASLARSHFRFIVDSWNFLRKTILTAGPHILKRWCRSRQSRRLILDKTDTEIHPYHSPVMDLAYKLAGKTIAEQRKHRIAYLLPYVNVEDLVVDPYRFIGLLHHRCGPAPVRWVPFDNAIIQASWKQGSFEEDSGDGCILMDPMRYSIWTAFDAAAVHRGEAYGTPRGLLILESQRTLMSFLRSVVTVIIGTQRAEILAEPSTLEDFLDFEDPGPCKDWMDFVDAQGKGKQTLETFGSIFAELPYSFPPKFDVNLLIDIAEARTAEAQDELWLLQTDSAYFHDRARYHEARWFDKVPCADAVQFTAREKLDNIAYIMTIKPLLQARDWQWLLEGCQAVKAEMVKPETKIDWGRPLPPLYESALGSLQLLLEKAYTYYQVDLKRYMLKFPQFRQVFKTTGGGKTAVTGPYQTVEVRDYATLYEKDRIGWCLFHLIQDETDPGIFDPSIVLQHLEDFLSVCSSSEAKRMCQEVYACVSDIAAITRMLKVMGLHRPYFRRPYFETLQESCPAWQVHVRFIKDPIFLRAATLNLGSAISPLKKFQSSKGRKDEKWVKARRSTHQALATIWERARKAYQMMLESKGVPQNIIETHKEWMTQCDSAENLARLAAEERDILDRLRASRQRTTAAKTAVSTENLERFSAHSTDPEPDHQLAPQKLKVKTRPENQSSPSVIDLETEEGSQPTTPTPILYTLKSGSTSSRVIPLLFAPSIESTSTEGKTIGWLDFVNAMCSLGFGAEHGGGSAFTFRGEIRTSDSPEQLQKRSIVVHKPHPEPEMGLVLLRGLGKRLTRRFGWERGSFDFAEEGIAVAK